MPKIRRKLYIGTSSWVYSHWDGIFYPEDLPCYGLRHQKCQRTFETLLTPLEILISEK